MSTELMTAKEKAVDLFKKQYKALTDMGAYWHMENHTKYCAQECALVTAQECLSETLGFDYGGRVYWQKVIDAINELKPEEVL